MNTLNEYVHSLKSQTRMLLKQMKAEQDEQARYGQIARQKFVMNLKKEVLAFLEKAQQMREEATRQQKKERTEFMETHQKYIQGLFTLCNNKRKEREAFSLSHRKYVQELLTSYAEDRQNLFK